MRKIANENFDKKFDELVQNKKKHKEQIKSHNDMIYEKALKKQIEPSEKDLEEDVPFWKKPVTSSHIITAILFVVMAIYTIIKMCI